MNFLDTIVEEHLEILQIEDPSGSALTHALSKNDDSSPIKREISNAVFDIESSKLTIDAELDQAYLDDWG